MMASSAPPASGGTTAGGVAPASSEGGMGGPTSNPGPSSVGGAGSVAVESGEALRERWASTLLALADGAAASLSPVLCTGSGNMDPRFYIKVDLDLLFVWEGWGFECMLDEKEESFVSIWG